MGRRQSPLLPSATKEALDYLKRAFERNSLTFEVPEKRARQAFSELLTNLRSTDDAAASKLLNDWLAVHLTHESRSRMLAALRRRRADRATTTPKTKLLRVSAASYAVLDELAGKLGTSVALALHAAAEVVLVSADNRAKAKKLALAMRLKVKAASDPASKPDTSDASDDEGDAGTQAHNG